jgi:hypothetical protein
MIFEMNLPDLGGDIAPRAGSFASRSAKPARLTDSAVRRIPPDPDPASHKEDVLFNGRKISKAQRAANSAKAGRSGRGHRARLRAAKEKAFGNLTF